MPASASRATACSEPAARLAVEPSRNPSCTREAGTDGSVAAVGAGLRTGAGAAAAGLRTGAGTVAAGRAGAGTVGAGTAAAGATSRSGALGTDVTAAPSA